MKLYRQGGSGLLGRQDKESEVEVVRACEEEVHKKTSKMV